MAGDWAIVRKSGPPLCTLTLAMTKASDGFAVAVKPGATYAVVRTDDDETLVVAEELVGSLFGDTATVLETMPGTSLERVHYERPFDYVDIPDAHYVILADYVTTDDGSGLVHQAPAFGADDLVTCRAYGLRPIDGPFGDFSDPAACEAQFRNAFLMGCLGAWTLHPSQVEIAKRVFSPDPGEVAFARRILEAMPAARRHALYCASPSLPEPAHDRQRAAPLPSPARAPRLACAAIRAGAGPPAPPGRVHAVEIPPLVTGRG